MKLTIATSGGIGNIRIHGEIDTDELDHALAKQTKSVLKPGRLASIPRDTAGSFVDGTQYEVGILREDGVHSYKVDESSAPAEVVEVLQSLVREIVLRKRRSRS